MPRLILNADDFGYTPGVNQAILELHQAGALTSTTLMATGSAMLDAARRALPIAAPTGSLHASTRPILARSLGIGCHVVLLDGLPASPQAHIPSLLAQPAPSASQPTPARFRLSLGTFLADLIRGRIREDEIERETVAQIRLLQQQGIPITHLDTHKHTHMFPGVLRPLLRAALQCGVSAIRNPFEPVWSIAATPGAPLLRRTEVRLLTRLRPTFSKLVTQAGLRTTNGAIGVLATGTLDTLTLQSLLHAASTHAARPEPATRGHDPVWELVCHPGYHDAALAAQNTRLLSARETERRALSSATPLLKDFTLTNFASL